MSGPTNITLMSSPAFIAEELKLTSTASGIGPTVSRQRLPSASLLIVRASAGASSIVTSPRCPAPELTGEDIGPLREAIGWSPTDANTCR